MFNLESFTQNGCYGNQPQPLEVVTVLTPAVPALLQKGFDFKQEYLVSFCFVLCNKGLTVNSCFQCFL